MNFIKKYKVFMSDMILNMIGFGIYIVSQQIILLPLLAKTVTDEVYANLVLYLTILNVVCNVTGGELGNVRLVRDSDYKKKSLVGDFTRILVMLSPIIAIITLPIFIYLGYSIIGSIVFVLTILMANVRLYSTCYYRLEGQFNKVIIQNLFYLVGIVLSVILLQFHINIYLILFIPELISVFYALKNSDLVKMKLNKTEEMKETKKKFSQLGFVSFLTNMMDYFDKFLIYPMFGPALVAVYYAVNSMSKIASLITNPMSSVILSWVSKTDDKSKNKILKMTLIANIPVLIIVTIITIPLTYVALRILYSQYLEQAMILIIPIAITTAFGTAAALIKSVLLKFTKTNKLVYTYIIYYIVFGIFAYYLSVTKGLFGFTIANLISRGILWLMFIVLLFSSKKEVETKEND